MLPVRLALAAALLSGCGSSPAPRPADQPPPDAGLDVGPDASTRPEAWSYRSCETDERLGGFTVLLADDYTGVNGLIMEGVVPGAVPQRVAQEGACALEQSIVLFCDPGCVPGETCGHDGDCIPYPANISVGPVTITGLMEPLSMEAKWGNHYTNPAPLPHPGFAAGAALTLQAAGEDLPGFTLQGIGVEPLVAPKTPVTVTSEAALQISWTAPGDDLGARVEAVLNINNHGATSAWVRCLAEDAGALEIPASLVQKLYTMGLSGFPSLELTRKSSDGVQSQSGCVDFTVESRASIGVSVEGVVSCTSDAGCPPDQTCGVDLQCHRR